MNDWIKIPQNDPKASYLAYKTEIDAAIEGVLNGGHYILGEESDSFEQEFAHYLGVSDAIGVASGTAALELALLACEVGSGDLVFTVSHTSVATIVAIERTGARPVLVDVDPETFTIDVKHLTELLAIYSSNPRSTLEGRPKAILPVHLYGHPANMSEILELARKYNLLVIEDCAQAHGTTFEHQKVGTWGNIAAFSFYPTKNLGAMGDGGAIVTNNPDFAERVRLLRQYGWRERYVSEISGVNSRLDELQAAILRVKLRHLDEDNQSRRVIASCYHAYLQSSGLILPIESPGAKHTYHQYVVSTSLRDDLRASLHRQGIATGIHYPLPVHLQPAYYGRLMGEESLPTTENFVGKILSLPMYAQLDLEKVELISHAINYWAENQG